MSKGTKPQNTSNTSNSNKNPNRRNSLDNYFKSPSDPNSTKKRKMSSLDLSGSSGSPPMKKDNKGTEKKMGEVITNVDTEEKSNPSTSTTTTTPSSERVCKHLDNQLSDMEKRLETSLTASLSASITASVTAGLKDLIDSSLKEPMETMSSKVNEVIDDHPTIKQHGEQIDSLETENILLKSKVNKMEDESTSMKRRLVNMETRALANNLIIRGIPEDEREKESTTRNKIYVELIPLVTCEDSDLQLQLHEAKKLEIRSCKRLGRYVKDRARPISAEFVRKEDLEYILSNKTNLNKGVYVDKEYPAEIEKKRQILRPIFTAAKRSNKYKKMCRMEKDILVIKGKRYNVNELHKLPKSLKPANVTSKTSDSVYGYFGELNPLSNFFPAPFMYGDMSFHCSEQLIQFKKAELFKDKSAIKRIMQTSTGHQCKLEGQNISNFNRKKWENEAYSLCKPGIKQKFLTNETPRQLLLTKTKGKRIAECTKDDVWGCGMAIQNEKCLDTNMWTGQGIMGQILEEIRAELMGPNPTPLPALPSFKSRTSRQNSEIGHGSGPTSSIIGKGKKHPKNAKKSESQSRAAIPPSQRGDTIAGSSNSATLPSSQSSITTNKPNWDRGIRLTQANTFDHGNASIHPADAMEVDAYTMSTDSSSSSSSSSGEDTDESTQC